ncbi:MAG: site-2 protease family protein [Planctomycetes bacterium]|nr:site-2 protease family protein [Planctomycetota bacterium]
MTPLAVSFAGVDPTYIIIWMIAWFAQMGFHEGGHAWAAWWLGDDTAYVMGKRTMNPLRHVDWNEPTSIFNSVVLPLLTTIMLGFPMGMAWVPVGVHNFRHPARDHAIVAFAGPAGGFLVALLALVGWNLIYPMQPLSGGDVFWMLIKHEVPGGASGASKLVLLLASLLGAMYFTAIVYSVFNLVPIPPLDGSNVLYYFGNWQLRDLITRIRPYGFFIIVVLFWILPGGVVLQPFIGALVWLFNWVPIAVWGAK